ncbi:hypothetical protein CHU93_12870 [Sandarakinorhabdus cyanobacteriorum]|uniref:Argininosuccinate lyase n=1 Tax=Sandarakinorhabdus cyanobacteriorum TaxID=1981098 RepID=A0A255YBL6_9SPHN|nr:hypothetical protein CHU93_12870 [Sandarakinorhabdus cyanobacteriorum]
MLPRPPFNALVILAALALGACGIEQSQPAPTPDADRWGHLPPRSGAAAAGRNPAGRPAGVTLRIRPV